MIIKNEDVLRCIGKKIKKARLDKNLTQEALAEKIDISTDLLRNIENNRNIGSIATLLNICNALDISTDYLFSELLTVNQQFDNSLYSFLKNISSSEKENLKNAIIYLDKNYFL